MTTKESSEINTRESNTPEKFIGRRDKRSLTGGSHKAFNFRKPVKQAKKSLYKKFGSKKEGKFIPSYLRVKISKLDE